MQGDATASASMKKKPVRVMKRDMSRFVGECVDKYKELAGDKAMKMKKVDTPFIDETVPRTSDEGGVLQPIAAKILMKNQQA